MIESMSSCTSLSASKPNLFTLHGTSAARNSAPGESDRFASHADSRSAMPRACGMPPTPGGRSSTRFDSAIANWPSRKNASRGSVAIQFGLPRPAFRYAMAEAVALALADFARKSLISNGLSASYSRSLTMSIGLLLGRDRPTVSGATPHQQHDDHA